MKLNPLTNVMSLVMKLFGAAPAMGRYWTLALAIPDASVKLADTGINVFGSMVEAVLFAATTGGVESTVKFVVLVPV